MRQVLDRDGVPGWVEEAPVADRVRPIRDILDRVELPDGGPDFRHVTNGSRYYSHPVGLDELVELPVSAGDPPPMEWRDRQRARRGWRAAWSAAWWKRYPPPAEPAPLTVCDIKLQLVALQVPSLSAAVAAMNDLRAHPRPPTLGNPMVRNHRGDLLGATIETLVGCCEHGIVAWSGSLELARQWAYEDPGARAVLGEHAEPTPEQLWTRQNDRRRDVTRYGEPRQLRADLTFGPEDMLE